MNINNKIPQLRIAVTFPCGKGCIYCRPGGEAVPIKPDKELSLNEILEITKLFIRHGVTDIKLTGGDPLLRNDIVEIVKEIKKLKGVNEVHLVTRHAYAGPLANELYNAGLDCLNFSLDSLNPETWTKITRVKGHEDLMLAIEQASQTGLKIKLNTVILKDINDNEIIALIEFAGKLKCTIKFLDLIVDIPGFKKVSDGVGEKFFTPLQNLSTLLNGEILDESIDFQPGGLGHPMAKFKMKNGATVLVKSSNYGAWYGDVCVDCKLFPCHDAIMAVRLTSDGKVQRCLLREDNLVDLATLLRNGENQETLDQVISDVIKTYTGAVFYSSEEIKNIKLNK